MHPPASSQFDTASLMPRGCVEEASTSRGGEVDGHHMWGLTEIQTITLEQ